MKRFFAGERAAWTRWASSELAGELREEWKDLACVFVGVAGPLGPDLGATLSEMPSASPKEGTRPRCEAWVGVRGVPPTHR